MTHRAHRRASVSGLLLALGLPFAVAAAPGDTLQSSGTLTDNNTGLEYTFSFSAVQHGGRGRGDVDINIQGPSRACSVHGPGSDEGIFPYQGTQCGIAFGNMASIDGCIADLEAHGFVHSDFPNVSYLGSTTIDVRYQKTRNGDQVAITIYTPKEKLQLAGKVVGAGAVMPSCNP